MKRRAWLLAGIGCLLGLALPARAFIPQAERVEKAAAETNKASGRTQALQLELTLRVAEREPIGTGVLVTHPTGLARLELRDAQGRVERHLRQGTEHSASRDGREIAAPRALLPPLFLLQGDSTPTLRSAMTSFGLDVEAIGLAPCGKKVCYVVGDPARVPPPPPPTEEELAAAEAEGGAPARPDGEMEAAAGPGPGDSIPEVADEGGMAATIWIESESFEIVRVESQDGVSVELGPVAAFGDVRFPQWLIIREPDRESVRLDFLQVVPVNAPAAIFKRSWLLVSPEAVSGSAEPSPSP